MHANYERTCSQCQWAPRAPEPGGGGGGGGAGPAIAGPIFFKKIIIIKIKHKDQEVMLAAVNKNAVYINYAHA